MFAPLIPHLEPEFELSVVEYSTQKSLADLVDSALAQLPNKRNISLIAESFSGPVAISILAQEGALFGASVLCATFTKSPHRYLARLAQRLPVSMWDLHSIHRIALDLFGINKSTPANIREAALCALEKIGPTTLRSRVKILSELDVSDEIVNIRTPMLYIYPGQDRILSESSVRKQMAGLQNIRFTRVAGPHLLLQTNPEECAKLIIEHVTCNEGLLPGARTPRR